MNTIVINADQFPLIREALQETVARGIDALEPTQQQLYQELGVALDALEADSKLTLSHEAFVVLTSVVQSTEEITLADEMRVRASSLEPNEQVELTLRN